MRNFFNMAISVRIQRGHHKCIELRDQPLAFTTLKMLIQHPLVMKLDAQKAFALQCNDYTLPCDGRCQGVLSLDPSGRHSKLHQC